MESKNEEERDWHVGGLIDYLSRGGSCLYEDEDGNKHKFYVGGSDNLVVKFEQSYNGENREYINAGDIVMASILKKEIFEKLKMDHPYDKLLPYRYEEFYKKMNEMADHMHKKIEAKLNQGVSFDEAWESVGEEIAKEIIHNSKGESGKTNEFIDKLRENVVNDEEYALPANTSQDEPIVGNDVR